MKLRVIFLGTTVAEESRKYGFTICSAGWSPELRSVVRIYPLPWPLGDCKAERWAEYECEVERPVNDARRESWRLVDGAPLELVAKHDRDSVLATIRPRVGNRQSIAALNETRSSLGLVFCGPRQLRVVAKQAPDFEMSEAQQDWLFDRSAQSPLTKRDFPSWPYVCFQDSRGLHELQFLDRGAYVLLARGGKVGDLNSKLMAQRLDLGHLLLVGNQCNRLTSWLVISCFPVRAEDWLADDPQMPLPLGVAA